MIFYVLSEDSLNHFLFSPVFRDIFIDQFEFVAIHSDGDEVADDGGGEGPLQKLALVFSPCIERTVNSLEKEHSNDKVLEVEVIIADC